MKQNSDQPGYRRRFLGLITSAFGFTVLSTNKVKAARFLQGDNDLEAWFNKLTGKHRMVFDTITPNNGFQVVWPLTFLESNNHTGSSDGELNAMIVLRNRAVVMALEDGLWKKYKLGKFYNVMDPAFNGPSERNLYWNPKPGEMPEPGSSFNDLIARGVMFCVCEKALRINSSQVAKSRGLNPDELNKEWLAGVLPGIKVVPSGVWALNRAQEHGASYCYAG